MAGISRSTLAVAGLVLALISTDAAAAGRPHLLRDIEPGEKSSDVINVSEIGRGMYFSADGPGLTSDLWKTNGETGGTKRVSSFDVCLNDDNQCDRCPRDVGTGCDSPYGITKAGRFIFFAAYDSEHGVELWRTQGTENSTRLVKDIRPGPRFSAPASLTNIDGVLYFAATTHDDGRELWRSDGTAAGTRMVADIHPGRGSSTPTEMTDLGRRFVFSATDGNPSSGHGRELWRSNGTKHGTRLIKDIGRNYPGDVYGLRVWRGDAYFQARDDRHGAELWRTTGTRHGTRLVADVKPGPRGSYPGELVPFRDRLYFFADDYPTLGLWSTDGTKHGTRRLTTWTDREWFPDELTVAEHQLFFKAADETHGLELWHSDGSRAGTGIARELNPGRAGSFPYGLVKVGGHLFFAARAGRHRDAIWRTDGRHRLRIAVADSDRPGHHRRIGGTLGKAAGRLIFTVKEDRHGNEPWSVRP